MREERMAAVEAAIAKLQKQVTNPQPTNWLQQITGSFKDEPAFDEVLAYGRAIRQGDESVKPLASTGARLPAKEIERVCSSQTAPNAKPTWYGKTLRLAPVSNKPKTSET
ncbi:hypothetical protein [Argonema galeatum]|uniref:hypothetical protein n=1 Tax=Argonema galeatum TaxID=2942762 RepID=UPI0020111C2B|nr:hypothetical protein [Argonema galeatum]MCL1463046.1 hypothetical protein [Argonema galeatum A003/A1]